MLLYTVLKGTEKAAMLADSSLANEHLTQHCVWGGRGFPSFDMDKKIIFIRNYALINWCSKNFWQRLYLNINNLIYWVPSAYRKLHSTDTCLIKNTDKCYKEMDNGCISGIVLIALKKAFDTVDNAILCQKSELYGLQLNELLLSESYLFNRKQFCRVRAFDSDIGNIDVGVPQWSCLGPLLFLIDINDLPNVVNASTVSMYTDDTSLALQSQDISQLNQTINDDLKLLDL